MRFAAHEQPLGTKNSTWRRKFSSDENLTMSGSRYLGFERTSMSLSRGMLEALRVGYFFNLF